MTFSSREHAQLGFIKKHFHDDYVEQEKKNFGSLKRAILRYGESTDAFLVTSLATLAGVLYFPVAGFVTVPALLVNVIGGATTNKKLKRNVEKALERDIGNGILFDRYEREVITTRRDKKSAAEEFETLSGLRKKFNLAVSSPIKEMPAVPEEKPSAGGSAHKTGPSL